MAQSGHKPVAVLMSANDKRTFAPTLGDGDDLTASEFSLPSSTKTLSVFFEASILASSFLDGCRRHAF
jgi:hypothetical protein